MDNGDSFGGPEKLSFLKEIGNEAKKRGPFYAAAAAFALVLAIGVVMWASYPRKGASDPNAVPIIRADAAPYRSKPDDPGGMSIPYRDSTVFNALHGETAEPAGKVENLLPQAEQPLPREKLIPGYKPEEAKTEAPAETKVEPAASQATSSESTPAPATAPAQESEVKAAEPPIVATTPPVENIPLTETVSDAKISNENITAAPAPAVAPAPVSEPAPTKTEAAPVAAAPVAAAPEPAPAPAPAPAAAKGDYFVQLGSVESESAAEPTWKKLQSSLSALEGLTLTVVRADLPKGVYYRLQSGPFEKTKAKDICAIVTAQKPGGCLVVKH